MSIGQMSWLLSFVKAFLYTVLETGEEIMSRCLSGGFQMNI